MGANVRSRGTIKSVERGGLGFDFARSGHEDSAVGAAARGGDRVGEGAAGPSSGVSSRESVEIVAFEVGFGEGDEGFRAQEEVGAVFDAIGGAIGEVHEGGPVLIGRSVATRGGGGVVLA